MGTDREQIIEVAVRYCTAMDTKDWSLLDRCFVADATVLYPGFDELRGLPALVGFLDGILGPLDATQHIATNFTVEVEGEEASATSYLHAQHVRHDAPGGPNFIFAGTYRDRLKRTEEGWRITRRELTTTWVEGNSRVLDEVSPERMS